MSGTRICKFSDHTPKCKLAPVGDIEILQMRVEERSVLEYAYEKYQNAQNRLQEEQVGGNPKIIMRCQEIMNRLLPDYQKYLTMKQTGIIR